MSQDLRLKDSGWRKGAGNICEGPRRGRNPLLPSAFSCLFCTRSVYDSESCVSLLASALSGPLQAAQPGQKGSPNCPSGPHLCMSWLPFPLPLQMTSPLARGLFHRAISQSGTAVFQIFITPDPLKVAKVSVSSLLRFSKGGRMGTHSSTSSLHRRLPSWQAAITTAQRFW